MKIKVLKAIPEVFSPRGNDYGRFVVKGGSGQMMRDNWAGVGARMTEAIVTVGGQVLQQKKKARANVRTKEAA